MSHSRMLRAIGSVGTAVWSRIPSAVLKTRPFRALGHCIHKMVCATAKKQQTGGTWFFRNMPLLSALTEQVQTMQLNGPLRLCCLGCCTGAEVYSVLWVVRTRIPQLRIVTVALDVSAAAVERAKAGKYERKSPEFQGVIPQKALANLFSQEDDYLTVRPWFRDGIRWIVGDARDPALLSLIPPQDVVLANNFMVHMNDDDAIECMVAVSRLVRPDGLLVCRGVDLDVRAKVARSLRLTPVTAYIEEIHNADPDLDARKSWPWHYTSLEPMNRRRPDWQERYAAIFRLPPAVEPAKSDSSRAYAARV
jgi:chemotaxis protein methyltransferase CheR